MIRNFSIIILFLTIILGCNEVASDDNKSTSTTENKKTDSISNSIIQDNSTSQNLKFIDKVFPKHPTINEGYKFLEVKDSINYFLLLERTNDSTIVFRTDSDLKNAEMHYGIALLNQQMNPKKEKSILTGNTYTAYEFIEELDSVTYRIRVGIDSIGSGDRVLVRLIKNEANHIITDVNMAN
ncbi:hypothetical protein V9L05_14200 [Bernardetia sp. Wsw4-3y2]|uniref:hypothetical protein n=1 Tax=Bernardetia sp. Wsw4-3y2 TaxID=3127471 RepID=UPI0030D5261A